MVKPAKKLMSVYDEYEMRERLRKTRLNLNAQINLAAVLMEHKPWVRLNEDEIHECFCHVEYETSNDWNKNPENWCIEFTRYIEDKIQEKNNGHT